MGALRRLARGVWVRQSATFATNSGVVIDGPEAALIDPGLTPDDVCAVKCLFRLKVIQMPTVGILRARM